MTKLPKDLKKKLKDYRDLRRSETGRVIYRDTAIIELLRKALANIPPSRSVIDRIESVERRLYIVEIKTMGQRAKESGVDKELNV